MSGADNALIANNVLYNWNQGTIMLLWRGTTDVVNNYGKEGPMTASGSSPNYRYMVNPHCDPSQAEVNHSIYAAGNVGPMSMDPDGDNWSGATRQVACYYTTGDFAGQEVPARWRRNQPANWASIAFPVSLHSASDAYSAVLREAGANGRIACDGTWVSARDRVDARIVAEVIDGTGIAYPPPKESPEDLSWVQKGVPCEDADGDGLSDEWEARFFGCATCADPETVGSEGYLLIEHYVNGTDPR